MTSRTKKIFVILSLVLLTVFVSAALISYLYYRDLKKILLARVDGKVSAVIGQPVTVGDISFSVVQGITITDIQVRNPEGFATGRLLAVKRVFLDLDFRRVSEGRFHFRKIVLSSPELIIRKDRQGRLNISEDLMRFLSKKSTIRYRIDELSLKSGSFAFGDDPALKNEEIDMTLKNLSSSPGTTTRVAGSTLWAGANKVRIEGWAEMRDDPKKFGITVSADDVKFSPFKEFLSKYRVDTDKARGQIVLKASGDTKEGVRVTSGVTLKSPGFFFYRKRASDIGLQADFFYDISSQSADIAALTIKVGNMQTAAVKGVVKDLLRNPLYDLEVNIDNLDLSAFDIMKGITLKGIVASDMIRVKGRSTDAFPQVAGSVRLRNGAVNAKDLDLRNIDGTMKFSSVKQMSADIALSASLLKVSGQRLPKPADARLSLSAGGQRRNVTLSANLTAMPFVIEMGRDSNASLEGLRVSLDGTLRDKDFTGKSSFQSAKIQYKDYLLNGLKGAVGIRYAGRALTIGSPEIKTDEFSLNAKSVGVRLLGSGKDFLLDAKGLDATYLPEKAALKGMVFSGRLQKTGSISGDFDFSVAEATFRGAAAGGISGKTTFSEKDFSLRIPHARLGGGSISIVAGGKISQGPFPIKAEVSAEHVGIGELARAFMGRDAGYEVTGNAEKAVFSGTIDSAELVHGKLTVGLQKVSVLDEKTKRRPLKDAALHSEIAFKGDVCSFSAEAAAGKVAATLTGTARDFLRKGRSVHLRVHLAETSAEEIRNAFWDIFPDALLYSGLGGSLSSDLQADYQKGDIVLNGDLRLKGFTLSGENDEYSIGPVSGTVPIVYGNGGKGISLDMPAFERPDFANLKKSYAQEFAVDGYQRIDAGSLRYGFRLLSEVTIWMKHEKGGLEIGRFNANIFGGRLSGSAVVDLSGGLRYRAGFVLDGLSLTRLCDDIEPIKGYISGRVNGVGMVGGSGRDLRQLIGKTEFWTYSTKEEETKVSREFLQKMGGTSLKAYIGDRRFDKGEMVLYLQNGFVIFRELEISHRNFFGMQDLSVKVAPLSNKISIDDLMWSIVEAATRAGERTR